LLVLVDGRTVYTPLFSGVFWEAQGYLLEDIERIEVISGPGGSVWGANAVNGVISIITRSAADTQGLFVTAASGPELNAMGALRYGTELAPDTHLRLFGKHVDHDESVREDGAAAGDPWRRTQCGFRLDHGAPANALAVQGDFYNNRGRDPEVAGEDSVLRGANVLARWSRNSGEDADISLQTYLDWSRFDDAVPAMVLNGTELAPAGRFRDDLLTLDVDFQHRFRPHAAHVLTWGLGFRQMHDEIDNAPALAVMPAHDQQLYSLFIQDEMRVREGLSLTLGTKLEHHAYTGFELQPSARLQWQVAPEHMLWGAVTRAIRAPSRIDREMFQAAPPYFPLFYGNPEFRSEKLIAYELGHRASLGSRVSTALSLFYNEYDDLRTTTISPDTFLPFRFANDLAGEAWGLEFTGTVQLRDNWTVRGGYNLLEERLRVRAGRIDITNGRNETADPQQQASIGSSL